MERIYHYRMQQVEEGIPRVADLLDDLLIHGKNQAEHDAQLEVLRCLEKQKVTLIVDKVIDRQMQNLVWI